MKKNTIIVVSFCLIVMVGMGLYFFNSNDNTKETSASNEVGQEYEKEAGESEIKAKNEANDFIKNIVSTSYSLDTSVERVNQSIQVFEKILSSNDSLSYKDKIEVLYESAFLFYVGGVADEKSTSQSEIEKLHSTNVYILAREIHNYSVDYFFSEALEDKKSADKREKLLADVRDISYEDVKMYIETIHKCQ